MYKCLTNLVAQCCSLRVTTYFLCFPQKTFNLIENNKKIQVLKILYYKILGHASCNRSSDEDAHASGELKPFLGKNEQYKLSSITKGTDLIHNSFGVCFINVCEVYAL